MLEGEVKFILSVAKESIPGRGEASLTLHSNMINGRRLDSRFRENDIKGKRTFRLRGA